MLINAGIICTGVNYDVAEKNEKRFVDPILGTLTFSDQLILQFLDVAEGELERLSRCPNLGLIGEVYPSAKHSRLEHHLGACYLALNLKKGRADDRRMLAVISLARGFGHLPFGFMTEEALLVAARLDTSIRSQLEDMMQPVVEKLLIRDRKQSADAFTRVITEYRPKELYRWFSARKLMALVSKLNIDRDGVVFHMLSKDSPLYRPVQAIDEFDYVQRDLYYSGVAKLQVAVDTLRDVVYLDQDDDPAQMRSFADPVEKLFHATRTYLMDRLYCDPKVLWLECCVKKAITRALLDGRVKLDDLLSMDDHALRSAMADWERQGVGKSVTTLRNQRSQLLGVVVAPAHVIAGKGNLDFWALEQKITGLSDDEMLSYPFEKGYLMAPKWRSDSDVSISFLVDDSEPLDLRDAVSALARMSNTVEKHNAGSLFGLAPGADFSTIQTEDILAYVFQSPIRVRPSKIAEVLLDAYRLIPDDVVTDFLKSCREDQGFIAPLWPHIWTSPSTLARFIADAGFQGYLAKFAPHVVRALKKLKAGGDSNRLGLIHEAAVFVDTVASVEPDCRKAWVLPDVLVGEGKDQIHQVDVIAVKLFDQRLTVEMVECTGEDRAQKAIADAEKLGKLESAIRRKFKQANLEIISRVVGSSRIRETFQRIEDLYSKYPDE